MPATRPCGTFGWYADIRVNKISLGLGASVETAGFTNVSATLDETFGTFVELATATATQSLSAPRVYGTLDGWNVEARNYSIPRGGVWAISNAAFIVSGRIADDFGYGANDIKEFVDEVAAQVTVTKTLEIFDGPSTAYPNDLGAFEDAATADALAAGAMAETFGAFVDEMAADIICAGVIAETIPDFDDPLRVETYRWTKAPPDTDIWNDAVRATTTWTNQ